MECMNELQHGYEIYRKSGQHVNREETHQVLGDTDMHT